MALVLAKMVVRRKFNEIYEYPFMDFYRRFQLMYQ